MRTRFSQSKIELYQRGFDRYPLQPLELASEDEWDGYFDAEKARQLRDDELLEEGERRLYEDDDR